MAATEAWTWSPAVVALTSCGVPTFAVPEQLDAILSVDGYHELHFKSAGIDNAKLAKSMFNTTKNGAPFTVVDYASAKGRGWVDADTLHRIDPEAVKKELTGAGFVFEAESKILANPSEDHTKPANDKSDQFVLRFRKPRNAPNTDKRPSKAQEDAIMKNYYGNTVVLNPQSKAANDKGERTRTSFYNADHTYQEFGRMSDGPGPMQMGTWWWDADGHNCELHQFPIDERSNVVCHDYVIDRPLNVMMTHPSGQRKGTKFMIVPGHVHIP